MISQAKTPVKPAAARHCWQPPPAGWLKCNVDGAFYAYKMVREQQVFFSGTRLGISLKGELDGTLMVWMQ
jgi:hypothetical protein